MDTPKVDDISWHIRYFESSYLMYIAFAAIIILYFVIVYCLKVPTYHFPDLKDILDNDPVINAHVIRDPVDRNEWYQQNQTTQSSWFEDQVRERKGEQADAIKDDANAELRNRKKSVRIKSNKDKNVSRQNSVRSHQTPSPYMSHQSLASHNQDIKISVIGADHKKRFIIDDNTYTLSEPTVFQGPGILRNSSTRRNVKQSSTFDDVADHILLHEDGDLLTIHQESRFDADDQPPEYEETVSQDKSRDIQIQEKTELEKNNEKCERDDVLSSFVSASPSIQTIISKSAAKTKLNSGKENEDKSKNERKIAKVCKPDEDWI